jgi:hypothetical protein
VPTADQFRLVPARATFSLGDDDDRVRLAQFKTAGFPAVTDGLPTILRATAWLAHEGENKNGLIFLREELPAAAAKIAEPNFLIMDFNHSSMIRNDHPKAIGLWYKATVAFDRHARGVSGQEPGLWGVMLQGISWAWAFPDYAQALLGEQDRMGAVRFSMGCLPTTSEFVTGADGKQKEIAHNPIFFALSALNVPQADPDAWGFMTDNTNAMTETATNTLLSDPAAPAAPAAPGASSTPGGLVVLNTATASSANCTTTGGTFLQPTIAGASWVYVPTTTVTTTPYIFATTPSEKTMADTVDVSALTAKVAELAAENETLKAELVEAKKAAETHEATAKQAAVDLDAEKTKLAELETVRDVTKGELAASIDLVQKYEAEIAAFRTEREAAERAQTEAAKAAKLAERIAGLPETYRSAHEKKDAEPKARVEAKWADMNDEQWESYKTEELLIGLAGAGEGRTAGMYLRKSREEGTLPVGAAGPDSTSRMARIRALLDK